MKNRKGLTILGIETSCDDTCIAVLKVKNSSFRVLSNVVSSQIEIHKKYGGVYPALAKREHQKNLTSVLEMALKEAKLLKIQNSKLCPFETSPIGRQIPNKLQIQNYKFQTLKTILEKEEKLYDNLVKFFKKYKKPKIDLIAVTQGPGLEPCLWVGLNFAKALSSFWDIPIIPVNHIESHVLVNFLNKKFSPFGGSPARRQASNFKFQDIFPAICLVVSGGHTQLILMAGIGKYKILGETRDDAAGECFDKCARILGLSYPGGPEIARLATQINKHPMSVSLPRPMINTDDYDFSFSGLKTAVLYDVIKKYDKAPLRPPAIKLRKTTEGQQYIKQLCVEIQQTIIDVLIKKTIKATKDYGAKSIIIGGGVSANCELRSQFKAKTKNQKPKIDVIFPPPNLSTDNAIMTAIASYFHQKEKILTDVGRRVNLLQAKANLRIE